jgi:hypothetical protein
MPTRANILMRMATKSPRAPVSNMVVNKIALVSLFKEPKGYYKRKTRSNKGVSRTTKPNSKRQKTLKLQALAREFGFKRVPRKGTMARSDINRLL